LIVVFLYESFPIHRRFIKDLQTAWEMNCLLSLFTAIDRQLAFFQKSISINKSFLALAASFSKQTFIISMADELNSLQNNFIIYFYKMFEKQLFSITYNIF